MGLFSNKISREDVRPGDHVYSWRTAYSYAHHGIYIGDDKVIHFTRGRGEETGTGTVLDILLLSSGPARRTDACQKCNNQQDTNGVVCCCLDCFLSGGSLYQFEYCVSPTLFLAKARGGTCTLAESDPPETVVHRATYLHENGFGCYNIFKNNCEDFAIYCKTGLLVIDRTPIGRSGQAASILGAPFAAVFSSPLRFLTTNITGMTVVAVGMYCLSRYAADIGVRRDASKVCVEDLTVKLGAHNLQVIPSTGVVIQE
uniref:TSA: Wollemia nobilis Ref_Wollemi_Transcript_5079_1226 transcribed RNA sequence n=1 Tax=Wollemia nobilis TaxID=56998 RepID=A0A0C9S8B9_9CONI